MISRKDRKGRHGYVAVLSERGVKFKPALYSRKNRKGRHDNVANLGERSVKLKALL